MHILIVDDDTDSAYVLQHFLAKKGHTAAVVADGVEALARYEKEPFEVLLIDWMLPKLDGIELIRRIRSTSSSPPLVMMLTAIALAKARDHALKAGADDYVAKPYDPSEVLKRIEDGMARRTQTIPKASSAKPPPPGGIQLKAPPRCVGVGMATSTGGPMALKTVLQALPKSLGTEAAFFLVIHAPDWMLTALPSYLQSATPFPIKLAEHRMKAEPGNIYLAAPGKHLTVLPDTLEMRLQDGEKENFVRPSADPLFRSMAAAFGQYGIAVILTGMGCDGTQGAAHVSTSGGVVMAQDPETATAPSMPKTLIQAGLAAHVPLLEDIGSTITQEVARLSAELKAARR